VNQAIRLFFSQSEFSFREKMTKKVLIVLLLLIVSLVLILSYRISRKEGNISTVPTNTLVPITSTNTHSPYFGVTVIWIGTGTALEDATINGPPVPPTGVERPVVTVPSP
jgi:hypothetical protein